jgi:hypothetical protein
MKTKASLEGIPPRVVFEVIANPDVRRSWDKVMCNFEIIEDCPDEGRSLLYYMVKTPIGVSNRDFLQQRKIKNDYPKEGSITMHFKSVTDSRCPEKPKTIRAETIISGYIIEPIDQEAKGTKLTIVS